ncbi:hypothetical protein BC835DRAFT_1363433 [Cytidiella melzeri]|nr:hypothetical protein BC835DRAFT_1363433 [Cytidiella melzeri]
MSSDEYFDELDSAFLQEVEAIEATHTQLGSKSGLVRPAQPLPLPARKPAVDVIDIDDSEDFGSFAIDDHDLEIIDNLTNEAFRNCAPLAGPSKIAFARTTSKATIQTTLDGSILAEAPKNATSVRQPMQRHNSNASNGFVGQSKKTKQWDHTAFAKTGWKKPQAVKGKAKAVNPFGDEAEEEEEQDEELEEFEQFPAPFVSLGYPPPMKLEADRLAARRWIYPLNQPRRDYQFNIVRKCLFENTLVALPTGLGKTFIAGVVMLNFYTWFPEGKVVFVAPTKPLVAQQIEACHRTCGIPGSHAAELTGQNPRAMRNRAWQEKRVFYMTPQTLMNDLKSDNCDPRDIVLLVIDEAHKGTGDYAYAQVIRYLMAKNPHFRVLALTATPGGKPEAVQAIVDALHISHIEIRDEQSLDLAPYLHKKHIAQHIIPMSEDVITIRDMLSEVMTPMIQKLYNAKLLYGNPKPVSLHPFSCTKALSLLAGGRGRGNNQWAYSMLSKLGALARVMGYLIEGSSAQCHQALLDLMSETNATPGSKSKSNQYQKDTKLQVILQELEAQMNQPGGFSVHPKMDKMKTLLVEHFAQKKFDKEDAQANGGGEDMSGDSRVMVFVSFRQCVDEVIAALSSEKPLIRAVPFIGQGTDKKGNKGYGQKEQLDVIKRFKAGEFNVLISTSIGEEGLDIGEIDMIICYDAQKTPIRMLQRIGRTGRKREGHVHVLLSEDREERNWDKADDNYKDVQRFIIKAEHLELYGDVERLIPAHIKPDCIEMVMDIEEYVREDTVAGKGSKSLQSKTAKRARNDDMMRNIPEGASTTFVSVKDLLQKGSKKRKKVQEFDELAGQDDSDDLEIAAGLFGVRRTSSMPVATEQNKKKLRQTVTMPKASGKSRVAKKQSKKSPEEEPTGSRFVGAGTEVSDDDAKTKSASLVTSKPKSKNTRKTQKPKKSAPVPICLSPPSSPTTPPQPLPKRRLSSVELSSSPVEPLLLRHGPRAALTKYQDQAPAGLSQHSATPPDVSMIDLTTPVRQPSPPTLDSLEVPIAGPSRAKIVDSSPPRSAEDEHPPPLTDQALTEPVTNSNSSMAWLLDDDEELTFELVNSSPIIPTQLLPSATRQDRNKNPKAVHVPRPLHSSRSPRDSHAASCRTLDAQDLGLRPDSIASQAAMPPPALPTRFTVPAKPLPSPSHTDPDVVSSPAPTFAVRAPGLQPKKRVRTDYHDSSPLAATISGGQRRLHQTSDSPNPKKKKMRKFADVIEAQRHNPWIDVEASHSGDELSCGGSDEEEDDFSDSDKQFLTDFPPTQASPSYDQSAVYRRSLMTQIPGGSMPAFAKGPFRRGGPSRPQGRAILSSSPPREDGSDDCYEFGSFVMDDDVEVSYADDSQQLSDL